MGGRPGVMPLLTLFAVSWLCSNQACLIQVGWRALRCMALGSRGMQGAGSLLAPSQPRTIRQARTCSTAGVRLQGVGSVGSVWQF